MRPPSLAALTILDAGPIGQIRAAAAAGWTSVGLRLQPLVETDERIVGRPERERELRRACAETGLNILEIGVFPLTGDFHADHVSATLDMSAEIGASFLVSPIEDGDLGRRAERFAELAEAAASRGLRALVEFNPYSACHTLGAALALLDAADGPGAALCLDALHFFRSGGTIEDLARTPPDRFGLLHFCDAAAPPPDMDEASLRRESRTARRLPGEGVLPLDALLDALPSDLPLSVEAPSPSLAGLPAERRAALVLQAMQAWTARRLTV